jgi:hypothetical protein
MLRAFLYKVSLRRFPCAFQRFSSGRPRRTFPRPFCFGRESSGTASKLGVTTFRVNGMAVTLRYRLCPCRAFT